MATGASGEATRIIQAPANCTLRNLRFLTTATNSGGNTIVVTVRVATASTAITATINSGDTAQGYNDTTHSATVTAGNRIDLQVVNNGTASSLLGGWSIGCFPN